jgi:biopolymer transport protein ExbB
MTAAGLAVAIPAVMAYNLLGRRLTSLETELQALVFDLRSLSPASNKL